MRVPALVIGLFAASATIALSGEPVPEGDAARLDASVLARAFIPSSNNVHGEVRLIRRDGGACLQTILYSRQLRRGLFEMKKKERACWPEGSLCHEESTNYLAAMDFARDRILGATNSPADDDTGGLQRMMIEFEIDGDRAGYTISSIRLEGPPEALRVVAPTPLASRQAHPYYISHAMFLMAENGLGLQGAELEALLGRAGWTRPATPELPASLQPVGR